MIAGKYQHKPQLPFVPGMEAAGDVTEVAPDVTDFAVGDRVMLRGGFTEEVIAERHATSSACPALLITRRARRSWPVTAPPITGWSIVRRIKPGEDAPGARRCRRRWARCG